MTHEITNDFPTNLAILDRFAVHYVMFPSKINAQTFLAQLGRCHDALMKLPNDTAKYSALKLMAATVKKTMNRIKERNNDSLRNIH